ncbi:effector protein Tle3 domain-containing protein [Thorsellia anophelis]|uniref:effector protein Tle3 domain-containing protein n=1 Tax=Thorsellia anophelis TaxID=336804 RepID=UPI002481BCEB|nr:DUF3274 domain-containing protein [Thorsellia anophelis]
MISAKYYRLRPLITRNKTAAESTPPKQERSGKHSSIVNSLDTPKKLMAFDLAIGVCRSYDDKDFWYALLHMADWRDPQNPDEDAKHYYRTGELPPGIKNAINKPGRFLDKIPKVSNEFTNKPNKITA